MGDPAGIGPELCLHAMRDHTVLQRCRPIVFGDARVLGEVAAHCGLPPPEHVIDTGEWQGGPPPSDGGATVVHCDVLKSHVVQPGRVEARCGRAAYTYLVAALKAAVAGHIRAMATAPLHKESLHLAGIPHAGHTEILADLTHARRVCMMMASEEIVVSLATTHLSYRDVLKALTRERVLEVIGLTAEVLSRTGLAAPRIGVCALNPHAGEHGLFGNEETTIIGPAIGQARTQGIQAEGPLVPDTAFLPEKRKRFDAYVVMYHDQGLIPFKTLAFESGVNITLGLPIVRTSVDHGTAFDIAWQGRASATSLIQSILWALRLSGQPGYDG